jgi:hypothetical protein
MVKSDYRKGGQVNILRQLVRGGYAKAAGESGCGCPSESASSCCGSSENIAETGELYSNLLKIHHP